MYFSDIKFRLSFFQSWFLLSIGLEPIMAENLDLSDLQEKESDSQV